MNDIRNLFLANTYLIRGDELRPCRSIVTPVEVRAPYPVQLV